MIKGVRIKQWGKACLFAVVMGALFLECSKDWSPTDPIQNGQKGQSNFQILSYGKVVPSLKKAITVSALVTNKNGGRLQTRFSVTTEKGVVNVNVVLDIPPQAIEPDSAVLSMQMDDEQFLSTLDVVFGPHGMDFLKPARLCVYVQNMDFTDIDPIRIGIYYDDQGNWTPMPYANISVNPEAGRLYVINAWLPHFSRYALSRW